MLDVALFHLNRSMKYVTKFLSKDEHDNIYMTDYYRKIDARRYMQVSR